MLLLYLYMSAEGIVKCIFKHIHL